MYQFSDSDSKDSDEGIRFKTASTRNKGQNGNSTRHIEKKRRKSRSKSPERRDRDGHRKSIKSKKHRREVLRSNSESDSPNSDRNKKRKKRPTHKERKNDEKKMNIEYKKSPDRKEKGNNDIKSSGSVVDKKQIRSGERDYVVVAKITLDEKETSNEVKLGHKEDVIYGPLPPSAPHLEETNTQDTQTGEQSPLNSFESVMGPQLPSHLLKIDTPIETTCIGPALPPQLQNLADVPCIGPVLPHDLEKNESDSPTVGPALPPDFQREINLESLLDDDNDEIYGPLPEGCEKKSRAHLALAERALELKLKQFDTSGDKMPVREEWMLELPEAKAAKFGLGPRQFRSKAGPDLSDRSSWTDTPDKKSRKPDKQIDVKQDGEWKAIQQRDQQQEEISKKHKRKSKESLVEMHQKELKNRKEDQSGPSERRPFSRDIDLQVNRFDEAQKKTVLKKAQMLDDRFSRGQSKFL